MSMYMQSPYDEFAAILGAGMEPARDSTLRRKRAASTSSSLIAQEGGSKRPRYEESKEMTLARIPASKCLELSGITSGPKVSIHLQSDPSKEYTVSRELLLSTSDYFVACLTGSFIESKTQRIDLSPEIEAAPFELLLQYILTGDLCLDLPDDRDFNCQDFWNSIGETPAVTLAQQKQLHAAIDMAIKVMELSQSFLLSPGPGSELVHHLSPYFEDERLYYRDPSPNSSVESGAVSVVPDDFYVDDPTAPVSTYPGPPLRLLDSNHIKQAWELLPRYNPIRNFLAKIAAQQYIMQCKGQNVDDEGFDFDEEMGTIEGFARDVLMEVRSCFRAGTELKHWLDDRGNRMGGMVQCCKGPMLEKWFEI